MLNAVKYAQSFEALAVNSDICGCFGKDSPQERLYEILVNFDEEITSLFPSSLPTSSTKSIRDWYI